jgi:tetratricopeptide (TPR) repeat protein
MEEALALYQQGLQTPAGADSVLLRQGIIEMLIEQGQFEQAEARIEELFSKYAEQADAFTRSMYPILNRYVYQKKYEKAVEVGRRALRLYPEHGNAFSTRVVMAEALVRLNRPSEADALVEEMFALYRQREDFVPLMHQVKSAYWKAGQKEKSQVFCRRLLAEFPQHPKATRILGDWICGALVLGQEDGVEEAIEMLYARYTEPAEEFLSVVSRIQERSLARNDFSGALSLGHRALGIYPEHPEGIFVYRWLAEASAALGDGEQAARWADGLLTRFGDHPEIVRALLETGHALRRYGVYDQAVKVYGAVLTEQASAPDCLKALTGMAQASVQLGDEARVEAIVERMLTDYRDQEKLGYSVFVIGEEYFFLGNDKFQSECFAEAAEKYVKAERLWQKIFLLDEQRYQELTERYAPAALFETMQCFEELRAQNLLTPEEVNFLVDRVYNKIVNTYPKSTEADLVRYQIMVSIMDFE